MLHIRFRTREPPGIGSQRIKLAMNSAVGPDFVDARLDILFELLPFPVLQDSVGNRMPAFR
jgi:hypothetical protein